MNRVRTGSVTGMLAILATCALPAGTEPDAIRPSRATPSSSVPEQASPTSRPTPSPSPGAWGPPSSGGELIPSRPTGTELTGYTVTTEDRDGSFVLTISAAQDRYRAGQLIDISASLEYVGPGAEVIARGSSHSLIGFALEGGNPPVAIHAASTSDCAGHQLVRGLPLEFPFAKSGGFEPGNPEDAFAEAYFADRGLRLPAGRWTVTAGTSFYTGADCGEELHSLAAAVTITVEP